MSNLNYYNTEFGDDIILKMLVVGGDNLTNDLVEYTLGRLDSIRYEDSEELREVRAIGTKFRVDARTTNYRGVFRCRFRATAINMRLIQQALGARMNEGTSDVNSLLSDAISAGTVTPPEMHGAGTADDPSKYVAPLRFTIQIRNLRTGFEDTLHDCIFTRRSKDIGQGDFTIIEMEGEFGYSNPSSSITSHP